MIKFKAINNPRTEDGGFGPVFCEKCNGSTSALLEIKFNTIKFVICNSCLLKGSEMILDEIINQCKGA